MSFGIRFIKTGGLVSDAIAFDTNSLWDHVELITPQGTYIGARASGGVEERPADYCVPVRERRYCIPCSDSQAIRIYSWAHSKVGTKYNFLDILGLAVHDRKFGARNSEDICSQFVIQAGVQGGIWMLNVLPGFDFLVTPETLHLSPLLIGKCVYKHEPA
jgi:uncharacterized protein YycO